MRIPLSPASSGFIRDEPLKTVTITACLAAAVACAVCLFSGRQNGPDFAVPAEPAPRANSRWPSEDPARPHIEVTPDHKFKKIQHKDANGLSPLEFVETPQGRVKIQRTFKTDGTLLKEEAFLDGKPVPIPSG
jgi:hypothetical protein